MTIADLKSGNILLFESIAGSRAYGTDLPTSDTDRRGVFVLPKKQFYGLQYIPQISDERNDNVYYEIGRFVELLAKNNPNMLEMLAMPDDCILFKHPLFEKLKPELFISKLCRKTFAGFALSQIKKAKGLNKKIVNPVDKERKTILHFCYAIKGQGSVPLNKWLKENNLKQEHCGLVNIPHFRDVYSVFYDEKNLDFKGIMHKENSNEVSLSSVPKGMKPIGIISFNKDGYKTYCKDYREYWEWVKKRNDERYENTISNGKNYDAKNMLHTFRLLDMAEEIAVQGKINVRRPNRDFLLKIRSGEFEYDDLLKWAEEKIEKIEVLYEKADLPAKPDIGEVNKLLSTIREEYYSKNN
ncbi:MAG TPA: nucleotidyltransferase [Bacteroidetes bacterium]|nr:nucleotidyltransferase [Bacteroidota bacterium]